VLAGRFRAWETVLDIARPDPPLTDGVIRLEPLSRRHLEGLESLGHDADVARFTYLREPFDPDDAVTWLARYIQGWRDGSCAGFAIVGVADDSFLGFCSLVHINHEGLEAEIGYITAPAARGRGVAGDALALITEWALATLGMKRLELRIDEDNPASLKVAERAGYRSEGLLTSVHLKQGRRSNIHIYARTA
jgi:RimJ/RimL family protein N-acetyltransferase